MTNNDLYIHALFGQHAVHIPAWFYVQDAGQGIVTIGGGSRVTPEQLHPLRFGTEHTHHLVVGELVVRPHTVIATNALRGSGIGSLITGDFHDTTIAQGDLLFGKRLAP